MCGGGGGEEGRMKGVCVCVCVKRGGWGAVEPKIHGTSRPILLL